MIRKSGNRFSEKDHAPSTRQSTDRFNLKQLRSSRSGIDPPPNNKGLPIAGSPSASLSASPAGWRFMLLPRAARAVSGYSTPSRPIGT